MDIRLVLSVLNIIIWLVILFYSIKTNRQLKSMMKHNDKIIAANKKTLEEKRGKQ